MNEIMQTLDARIRSFYELINKGDFLGAYTFIDPDTLEGPTEVFGDVIFEEVMRTFQVAWGKVNIKDIIMEVHIGENNRLYNGRDYAVGLTYWYDTQGKSRRFVEKWVHNRTWDNLSIHPNLWRR